MLKKFVTLLSSLLIINGSVAAKPTCEVDPRMEGRLVETYRYQVTGSGRLHFYSAPDERCIRKNVFVINGDELTAYTEFGQDGKWTSVSYDRKNGDSVSGWVRTERLRFLGASGMNMDAEKVKYYQKAAAAAKAGRLGVPR